MNQSAFYVNNLESKLCTRTCQQRPGCTGGLHAVYNTHDTWNEPCRGILEHEQTRLGNSCGSTMTNTGGKLHKDSHSSMTHPRHYHTFWHHHSALHFSCLKLAGNSQLFFLIRREKIKSVGWKSVGRTSNVFLSPRTQSRTTGLLAYCNRIVTLSSFRVRGVEETGEMSSVFDDFVHIVVFSPLFKSKGPSVVFSPLFKSTFCPLPDLTSTQSPSIIQKHECPHPPLYRHESSKQCCITINKQITSINVAVLCIHFG